MSKPADDNEAAKWCSSHSMVVAFDREGIVVAPRTVKAWWPEGRGATLREAVISFQIAAATMSWTPK